MAERLCHHDKVLLFRSHNSFAGNLAMANPINTVSRKGLFVHISTKCIPSEVVSLKETTVKINHQISSSLEENEYGDSEN